MLNWKPLLATVIMGRAFAQSVQAVPVVRFTSVGEAFNLSVITEGWEFTTNSAITVTDLGFFDMGLDGLAESHDVGIFDAGGSLVTSATVAAGTVAPLIDQFRYVAIAPVLLAAGQTYRIGAFYIANSLDHSGRTATGFVTDPSISFQGARAANTIGLGDPTTPLGVFDPAFFGPNFIIGPAAAGAPELNGRGAAALGSVFVILCLLSRKQTRQNCRMPGLGCSG